jgi:predicted SAM-dependent methyltransferase
MNPITRLNLGCGDRLLDGYVNLDIAQGHQIYPLQDIYKVQGQLRPVAGEGLLEIRASHVLEHFSHRLTRQVLADWIDRLRPGGVLRLAVPDLAWIARHYLAGEPLPVAAFLCGQQKDEYDVHRAVFDEPYLRRLLEENGLIDVKRWVSPVIDCAALALSLNLQGTKAPRERSDT